MRACVNFSWIHNDNHHHYFKDPVQILKSDSQKELLQQAEKWSQTHYVFVALNYEAESGGKAYVFTAPVTEAEFGMKEQMNEPLLFAFAETKEEIMNKIQLVQEQIRLGNTYQVNYTTRLTATGYASPYAVYCQLTQEMNGRYTMFIEDEDESIISISPELFFQYDRLTNEIVTQPMKGTMPRGRTEEEDKCYYEQLQHSLKDRAENVMIVDLLRNDLSRIAAKNSVQVEQLFEIVAYPTVYQMVSTVKSVIRNKDLSTIVEALFPCGSITGAPKRSTMNIIEQLEGSKRGIYCGALGLLMPERMIFNVPIRTIEKRGNHWTYGVGGGITIDSEVEKEFDEMVAKSSILQSLSKTSFTRDFHLIETMKVSSEGIARRSFHEKRLKNSLAHFKMRYDDSVLQRVFETTSQRDAMLRVTVYDGYISSEIKNLSTPVAHRVRFKKMKEKNVDYLQHKTSRRAHYTTEGNDLSLYYNDEGLLTEFNIGNLVYLLDGTYYTPSVDEQLPGCFQAALLEQGLLKRRDIMKDEITSERIEEVWMINSLREWVPVELPARSDGNSFKESVK